MACNTRTTSTAVALVVSQNKADRLPLRDKAILPRTTFRDTRFYGIPVLLLHSQQLRFSQPQFKGSHRHNLPNACKPPLTKYGHFAQFAQNAAEYPVGVPNERALFKFAIPIGMITYKS